MADSAPGEDVIIAFEAEAASAWNVKGEEVVGRGFLDASDAAASFSCCFLAWNLAARSLSRSVFFFDFFLDFVLSDLTGNRNEMMV